MEAMLAECYQQIKEHVIMRSQCIIKEACTNECIIEGACYNEVTEH